MTIRHPPRATTGAIRTSNDAEIKLREHFLGWQCRVRQYALRKEEGSPTAGMRPLVQAGDEVVGHITVLIIKKYSREYTAQFRYMAQKTNDPAERYQSAMQMLSSAYYQRAKEFSDEMTALFALDSPTGAHLLREKLVHLTFTEYNQSYHLPCAVRALSRNSDEYQATFWHNSLFNSTLPGEVLVVGFQPDWSLARARPALC